MGNGKVTYKNSSDTVRVVCLVSKEYLRSGNIRYWYAFRPSQREFLLEAEASYIALGCGSANEVVLMQFDEFEKQLADMRTTESDSRYYWHVEVFKKDDVYLLSKPTDDGLDVSNHLI